MKLSGNRQENLRDERPSRENQRAAGVLARCDLSLTHVR